MKITKRLWFFDLNLNLINYLKMKITIIITLIFFGGFISYSEVRIQKTEIKFIEILKNKKQYNFEVGSWASEAYTYGITKLNGKYCEFYDSFGYCVSTIPPENSAMLSIFFIPEYMRKASQGEEYISLYKKTCAKNQLQQKSCVPPSYSNLLSQYRWFIKGGPFSTFMDKYELKYIGDTVICNKPANIHSYKLKKPIGWMSTNSGKIYTEIKSNHLLKIRMQNNFYFSTILHHRVPAKTTIMFEFDEKLNTYVFSEILVHSVNKGLEGWYGIRLITNPMKINQPNKKEVQFYRNCEIYPYVFYEQKKWSATSFPIPSIVSSSLKKGNYNETQFVSNDKKPYCNPYQLVKGSNPDHINELSFNEYFKNVKQIIKP